MPGKSARAQPAEFRREVVLALDQGTLSTRALLLSRHGERLFQAECKIDLLQPDTLRIEQDAGQIIQSLQQVIDQALQFAREHQLDVHSAGLATQRSSVVAWRPSSGQPISPVISWQDTRAQSSLSAFEPQRRQIHQRTGLRLNAHYGATKMQWLLQQDSNVQQAVEEGDCLISPLASLLIFHSTRPGPPRIDVANASRSLLLNLQQQDWDEELLHLFAIERNLLPACRPIRHDYGCLRAGDCRLRAVNGDQNAAVFANGMPHRDRLRVNLGTGGFMLGMLSQTALRSSAFEHSTLLASIVDSDEREIRYSIEGTVNGAAAALSWLQQRIFPQPLEPLQQQDLSAIEPPLFINAVGGLGSPYWNSRLCSGFVDGFDPAADPLAALGGLLESIVFLLHSNQIAITEIQGGWRMIEISGGLSQQDFLCQRLADLSGLPVERSGEPEATARGIAWQALGGPQNWNRETAETTFHPQSNPALHQRYQRFRAELERRLRDSEQ